MRGDTTLQARLALAADSGAARDALVAVLAAEALAVTACSVTATAIDELAAEEPAVFVLVADMARPPGLAALRRVQKRSPQTRVVVVSPDRGGGTAARESLNAGAAAFVPAERAERALVPAIGAVLAGFVCAPRAARGLVAKPTFSHREKEVLTLLVHGLSNKEIAGRLYLSESTVKTHLASAFAKLGVRSRKHAAALLLDPAEGFAEAILASAPALARADAAA